jgi:hypothetical protein
MSNSYYYREIIVGITFLYAAARYTILARFFRLPVYWLRPHVVMSRRSRYLLFVVFSCFGLWETVEGIFHLDVNLPIAAFCAVSAACVLGSFLYDMHVAPSEDGPGRQSQR